MERWGGCKSERVEAWAGRGAPRSYDESEDWAGGEDWPRAW